MIEYDKICCPICAGSGLIDYGSGDPLGSQVCANCHGSGYLDWVEAIIGKQKGTITFNDNGLYFVPYDEEYKLCC